MQFKIKYSNGSNYFDDPLPTENLRTIQNVAKIHGSA